MAAVVVIVVVEAIVFSYNKWWIQPLWSDGTARFRRAVFFVMRSYSKLTKMMVSMFI
jgi:hypothetical protein